jgi:competence protein ComEC
VIRALRPRWVGDPGLRAGKPQYLALIQAAGVSGTAWAAVGWGMDVELDGVTVDFLHPDGEGDGAGDANDASVVVRIEYGEFAMLMTGDAPSSVEERLADRLGRRLDADVLKVGHHGSATSTSAALLEATGAHVALISAGRGNRYGHPHRGVLRRLRAHGLEVYRTDLQGSIVLRADARGRFELRTELGIAR